MTKFQTGTLFLSQSMEYQIHARGFNYFSQMLWSHVCLCRDME